MIEQLAIALAFLVVVGLADALERGYLRQLGRELICAIRRHPVLVAACVLGGAAYLWVVVSP